MKHDLIRLFARLNEIAKIRNEVRVRQWAEMIRCRNESGLTVADWCERNGVKLKTYYYRLKRVREALCSGVEHHDIVSVDLESENIAESQRIELSVGSITVLLPDSFNADTLKRLLGVLQ